MSISASVSFSFPFYLFCLFFFPFLLSLCFEKILVYEDCSLCSRLRIEELLWKIPLFHPNISFVYPLLLLWHVRTSFTTFPLDFVKHQSTLCSSHISLYLQELSPPCSYILLKGLSTVQTLKINKNCYSKFHCNIILIPGMKIPQFPTKLKHNEMNFWF